MVYGTQFKLCLVAARHVSKAVEVLSTDQFGFGIGKAFHRKEALTVRPHQVPFLEVTCRYS